MSTWLKNFRTILESKPVVIMYGNVRDRYIDDNGMVYENLTSVIKGMTRGNHAPIHFTNTSIADATGREKKEGQAAASRNNNQLSVSNELSDTAPQTTTDESQYDISRVLARWDLALRDPNNSTLAVLFYLDKLISFQNSYSDGEMKILYWLEKIIENITNNNRLILVALQDSQIPTELYTHSPKVRLVEIPLPQQADRRSYINNRLRAHREHVKLISDLSDGLYLRDLDPIIASLPQNASPSDIRKHINKYRLGEQEDYWGSLTTAAIKDAVNTFTNKADYGVKGQDEAVNRVVDMLAVAKAGLSGMASDTGAKPKGVLFFAGPSGVGKTFLAKKLARFLFSSEDAFVRFDMSEFKEEHSVSKLIGSPPGYVGYEQGGQLTNAVRSKPFSVILFDEIEKAHPKIMDIFLQVLDDGRLTDSRGQTVFFTESVIIFTSNIGTRTNDSRGNSISERHELDELLKVDQLPAEKQKMVRQHFRQAVEQFFIHEISRPELLNRIGNNIVAFNYINSKDVQLQIVESQLNKIANQYANTYKDQNLSLHFEKSLIEFMVENFSDQISQFGGRAISNLIQDQIMPNLAKQTLVALDSNTNNPTIIRVRLDEDQRIIVNREIESNSANRAVRQPANN